MNMRHRLGYLLTFLFVIAPLAGTVQAQPVTFRNGETARYKVGWGIFGSAGDGTMTLERDTLRGDTVWHATLAIKGGIPGARINERLQSWMDMDNLVSYRYEQYTRYPSFKRDRLREFYPSERRWTGHTNFKPEEGELPSDRPLDEVAFLYYIRTLDLKVGTEITLDDYWKPEGNPVRLRVLRREVVTVPAGTFTCIVVQPIIKTSGLFSEGGEAEVYFADTPNRELVMMRAKLSIATLTLRLQSYKQGK